MFKTISMTPMREVQSAEGAEVDEHLALTNHLILRRIFSFLSLPELKGARLVCRSWGLEAAKGFRATTAIHLESPKAAEEGGRATLEEQAAFVHSHLRHHTLTLSFLNPAWLHKTLNTVFKCEDTSSIYYGNYRPPAAYYSQRNNVDAVEQLLAYMDRTGVAVVELRVEMMLRDGGDSGCLSQLLRRVPNLKTLSLDIVVPAAARLETPLASVSPSLHCLELRFHVESDVYGTSTTSLSLGSLTNFLGAFNPITFLDLDSLVLQKRYTDCCPYTTLCLEAISTTCAVNPAAYPNLTGLQAYLRAGFYIGCSNRKDALTERHISFPRPLTHLYLQVQQIGEDALLQVERILQHHAPTLQVIDLIWIPTAHCDTHIQINFPHCPNLKTLVLGLARLIPDWYTLETLDAFNLRSLFRSGQLPDRLPSLITLSILTEDRDNEIWGHIFPLEAGGAGEGLDSLAFGQLRSLTTSATLACDSPQLRRFFEIFPRLRTLTHVRVEEDQIFGCEHSASSGSSGEELEQVRRWKVARKDEWWDEFSLYYYIKHNQLAPGECKW